VTRWLEVQLIPESVTSLSVCVIQSITCQVTCTGETRLANTRTRRL